MTGLALLAAAAVQAAEPRGTGDLGLVVEREAGSVLVVETTGRTALGRVTGLGDLSHASVVFGRDGRYAYVFGRDGGLSKVDLLERRLVARIVQAGNAIGGAISDDGRLIAVSNYEPGGVRVFDARTPWPRWPTSRRDGATTAGCPRRWAWSTCPATASSGRSTTPARFGWPTLPIPPPRQVRRFPAVGKLPYDGNVTPDGRFYLAGLFGEDGLALLDLWDIELAPRRILDGYGRGEEPLPVYKMPHLEGWASVGDELFLPAVGRHELLVVDKRTWAETGRHRAGRASPCSPWRARTAAASGSTSPIPTTIGSRSSTYRAVRWWRHSSRARRSCTSSSPPAASRPGSRPATTMRS